MLQLRHRWKPKRDCSLSTLTTSFLIVWRFVVVQCIVCILVEHSHVCTKSGRLDSYTLYYLHHQYLIEARIPPSASDSCKHTNTVLTKAMLAGPRGMITAPNRHAQNAGLNTSELLDLILCSLSSSDVLNARLVCRGFRDAVDESPTLSVRAFTKPDKSANQRQIFFWKTNENVLSETAHFIPPQDPAPAHPESSYIGHIVVAVHPRLRVVSSGYDARTTEISFPPLKELLGWEEGGRWEQMVIMQPPCNAITIRIRNPEARKPKEAIVRNGEGVRLGDVVNELREMGMKRDTIAGGFAFPVPVHIVFGTVQNFVWEYSHWVTEAEQHQAQVKDDRIAAASQAYDEEDFQMEVQQ